jgi:phenylpropionate dioxygenase-like ring-hydroxylating dioxygenase large terminal subunit
MTAEYQSPPRVVPSFEGARTRHQRARASALSADYWYPVLRAGEVRRGQVVEVIFQGRSIAVFRGSDDKLRALENRCAHRQLKLSDGDVDGCALRCLYHGWAHNERGEISDIPHDLFGRSMPRSRIGTFPVEEKYGLVWVFPGAAELADRECIPDLPELAAGSGWTHVVNSFTFACHHSVLMENVCDFSHAYLHRKFAPFGPDAKLTHLDSTADRVSLSYQTKVAGGRVSSLFLNNAQIDTQAIEMSYEYPFQRTDTGGQIREWCFPVPVDDTTTRAIFIFAFAPGTFRFPLLSIKMPAALASGLTRLGNVAGIRRVLRQDILAVGLEQRAYEQHYAQPVPELNPAVRAVQDLIIEKADSSLLQEPRTPKKHE